MNKHLMHAYTCIGRGWWPILDKYIPAILEIDPECDFDPKEKYGTLRLQATAGIDCEDHAALYALEEEAEALSGVTCEYCGKPGRLRTERRDWYLTLCDECDKLQDDKEGWRSMYLETQMLLGKKYEQAIGSERTEELWEQWFALEHKSDEYQLWYNALSLDEQGAVIGWNAEVEDYVRSEMWPLATEV